MNTNDFKKTDILGAFLISHQLFSDERGSFYESMNLSFLDKLNVPELTQTSISNSKYGVLRGMHYQVEEPLIQFVSCIRGEVIDLAVDLRKKSSSFGKTIKITLKEDNCQTLYLPTGVAHGFLCLSDKATMLYHICGSYNKKFERGVNYKSLNFKLPMEPKIINKRDSDFPTFEEAEYL
tara:strand:+ start:219 stop:755 length:537 start_codon:yes stop_codon:yes gene_type:complete